MSESLAEAVVGAAGAMSNLTLAGKAHMATRTLREILDPASRRRFGRATLSKLDGPLGWPPGRAWQLYQANTPSAGDTHQVILREMSEMKVLLRRIARHLGVDPNGDEV